MVKRTVDKYGCITLDGERYYLGLFPYLEVWAEKINGEVNVSLAGQPVKVLSQGNRPEFSFDEIRHQVRQKGVIEVRETLKRLKKDKGWGLKGI